MFDFKHNRDDSELFLDPTTGQPVHHF
jgi:hypothetical protein